MFERLGKLVPALSIIVVVAAMIDAITQSVKLRWNVLPDIHFIADAAIVAFWGSFTLSLFVIITKRVDNPRLAQALVAGVFGTVLILIEEVGGWKVGDFNFGLEELLLASAGLNMLIEEARLAEVYKDIESRRREAQNQTEKIIKDVKTFRGRVFSAAEKVFGPRE